MKSLSQKAISEAIKGNWKTAIDYNLQIIKNDPQELDALVRTANAYFKIGNLKKAKSFINKALQINPESKLAGRMNSKIENAGNSSPESMADNTHSMNSVTTKQFLEEPGKTAIVKLVNLGDAKIHSTLDCGQRVLLNCHKRNANITTHNGRYIGRLPDDLSARLRGLIQHGNEYAVNIKSIEQESVTVFIKETKRADKIKQIPSFSSEKIDFISFTFEKI